MYVGLTMRLEQIDSPDVTVVLSVLVGPVVIISIFFNFKQGKRSIKDNRPYP